MPEMQIRDVKDAHSFRQRTISPRRVHKNESPTARWEEMEHAPRQAATFCGGRPCIRIPASREHPEKQLVEVAGIEPASEGLQRVQPTCLSDSLVFAAPAFDSARTTDR